MNLKEINTNPISVKWKERYTAQPDEIKKKLDELSIMKPKDYQLKVIKKSKTKPLEGDIFVLSPYENKYFYGKVIKVNINHVSGDNFIQGKSVILIFRHVTDNIDISTFNEDYNNLLIGPEIIDTSYWTKGFFYTIGNRELTNEEMVQDYGFYKISNGKYYTADGNELRNEPNMLGTYGIATITGIASKVHKELIINQELI